MAVGALVGALGGEAGGRMAILTTAGAGSLLLAALVARQFGSIRAPGRGRYGWSRIGMLLAVGALVVAGRLAPANLDALNNPPTRDGPVQTGTLQATGRRLAVVVGISSPKGSEQIAQIDLPLADSERSASAGSTSLVEALLPRYPVIGSGDAIAVSGRVVPAGNDDYGSYLRQIGAAGTLRSPTLERLAGPSGPAGVLSQIRTGSADALARALPEPQAGLASGILVGLRDRVDRDLAAAFTTAGVSHIVAISGWNIAIVAALVSVLLGRFGSRTRTAIGLLAIVAYTLVAGASPSVTRAAIMAVIGLTARAGGRSGPALAGLGWAILTLLLIDPSTVSDPGFELSGLATAGLIAWAAPLTGHLARWRVAGQGLPGWLAQSLAISLAAEAATLPIVLLTFGRLAIIAPLANLVIVPLVPPAMAAGGLALGAGWLGAAGLPQPLVTILGLPAWAALSVMVWLVRSAAALPFASVTLAPPWNVIGAGLAMAAVGGLTQRRAIADAIQEHGRSGRPAGIRR